MLHEQSRSMFDGGNAHISVERRVGCEDVFWQVYFHLQQCERCCNAPTHSHLSLSLRADQNMGCIHVAFWSDIFDP